MTEILPTWHKSSLTKGPTGHLVLKNLQFISVCTVGRLRASFSRALRRLCSFGCGGCFGVALLAGRVAGGCVLQVERLLPADVA